MAEDSDRPIKRQRSANYSNEEKALLLGLIFNHRHILIESKKTDAHSCKEKEAAWQKVAIGFNLKSTSGQYRSVESLRKFFDNHKKLIRKNGGSDFFNKSDASGLLNSVSGLELRNECSNILFNDDHSNSKVHCGETIKIKIEGSSAEEDPLGARNGIDWSDSASVVSEESSNNEKSNPSILLQPLLPPEEVRQVQLPSNKSWSFKKRKLRANPFKITVPTSLAHRHISRQYCRISAVKLKLAKLRLEHFKKQMKEKEERDKVEFELRKQSLELDISMKKALVNKVLNSSSDVPSLPFEFLQRYS